MMALADGLVVGSRPIATIAGVTAAACVRGASYSFRGWNSVAVQTAIHDVAEWPAEERVRWLAWNLITGSVSRDPNSSSLDTTERRLVHYCQREDILTSCGATVVSMLTRLVGPEKAIETLEQDFLSKEVSESRLVLAATTGRFRPYANAADLYVLGIEDTTLWDEDPWHYGGHIWMVAQVARDHFLWIGSYLNRYRTTVETLSKSDLARRVEWLQEISAATKWTQRVNDAYRSCFGVDYSSKVGLSDFMNPSPFRVKVQIARATEETVDEQAQRLPEAERLPAFPRTVLFRPGELPNESMPRWVHEDLRRGGYWESWDPTKYTS